ncbi:flagellar biosynthetic protein FliO [Halobacillus sp. Nhm2S1]|uniref:flagellar biosynthetic protein FliO n=1 Tax=Halobacillus sp. Nhm2S1 TaxID=2866716 RepID=UPI001C72C049|nr:flagellar biosynthetic protein FliO [Halobacillus sp. Nhm2S1]MBX0356434.1 flagellar biosynthetic protein FliO [Halobacillus sp. Nhm2S1]
MFFTTRVTVAVILFIIMMGVFPFQGFAQPTAFECLENPQLEGCPSSEGGQKENQQTSDSTVEMNDGGGLVWNVVKLIFALIFVVALLYGLLKFFNQKNKVFNQNRTMENLGGMNLGPNRSIQAVRIGGQVFILGVGETVQIITEITEEETKQTLINQELNGGSSPQWNLKKWTDKWKEDRQEAGTPSSIQFQQLFENQLSDMKNKRKKVMDEKRRDSEHE